MAKSNGGDAFPVSNGVNLYCGMTMRQYYKAKALQMISFDEDLNLLDKRGFAKEAVNLAATYADAMIAEDEEFEGRGK